MSRESRVDETLIHVYVPKKIHYKMKLASVYDSTSLAGVVVAGQAALEEKMNKEDLELINRQADLFVKKNKKKTAQAAKSSKK